MCNLCKLVGLVFLLYVIGGWWLIAVVIGLALIFGYIERTNSVAQTWSLTGDMSHSVSEVRGLDSEGYMKDEPVTIPDHYKVLADALKPLLVEIRDGLAEKLTPKGTQVDMCILLPPLLPKISTAIERLTDEMQNIPGCYGIAEERVAADDVITSVYAIKVECRRLLKCYRSICESRVSLSMIKGQTLMAECVRDPLQVCAETFAKIIDIVEMAPNDLVKKYGSTKLGINVTFSPAPAERLQRWAVEAKLIE